MKSVNSVRDTNGPDGCFSQWTTDSGNIYQCAEPECLNNQPMVSAIPPVVTDKSTITYRVELRPHPNHGNLGTGIGYPGMCYEILDVQGRSAVLIHIGNYAGEGQGERTDTEACNLLGTDRAKMVAPGHTVTQEVVEHSTQAITAFYKEMGGEPFTLSVTNRFDQLSAA